MDLSAVGETVPTQWPEVAVLALILLRDEIRWHRTHAVATAVRQDVSRSTVLVRSTDNPSEAIRGASERRRRAEDQRSGEDAGPVEGAPGEGGDGDEFAPP